MSAFIIEPDTMHNAVRAVHYASLGCWDRRELFGFKLDDPERDALTPTELGRRLYTLNQEAIRQRYPGDDDYAELPPDYRHPDSYFPDCSSIGWKPQQQAQVIRCYKALCCLIYQCSEGNVPERPEYKSLERAAAALAAGIVSHLPEYEQAAWG